MTGVQTCALPISLDLAAGNHCVTVTDNNGCETNTCVTLTDPVITGVVGQTEISLNIYPNPANELFTIEMELPQTIEMTIAMYDLAGSIVFTANREAAGHYKENFDVTKLAAGMYMLNVQASGENLFRRILKR